MVLAEAMTAGVPVVAVDAPGAREVVEDGVNGRLLAEDDVEAFAQALHQIASLDESDRSTMKAAAVRTAKDFSVERCTDRLAEVYRKLLDHDHEHDGAEDTPWQHALHLIETEWRLWRKRAEAAIKSIQIEEKRD
jgi:lipoate-protein ligase A